MGEHGFVSGEMIVEYRRLTFDVHGKTVIVGLVNDLGVRLVGHVLILASADSTITRHRVLC
jgi:hypothetical protein